MHAYVIAVDVCRLLLCVVVGFLAGIIVGGADRADNWGWPTEQMTSRGQPEALAVGLLIALPSGVGVALSKADDGYAGGLVGVAISASLLPPAVNAGICWGLAPFSALEAKELGIMGGYSLLLTLVNIVAIIFAGSLVSQSNQQKVFEEMTDITSGIALTLLHVHSMRLF